MATLHDGAAPWLFACSCVRGAVSVPATTMKWWSGRLEYFGTTISQRALSLTSHVALSLPHALAVACGLNLVSGALFSNSPTGCLPASVVPLPPPPQRTHRRADAMTTIDRIKQLLPAFRAAVESAGGDYANARSRLTDLKVC